AHIQRGAQRATNQALDFQGTSALLATAGLALGAFAGGAWQHAVFGGQPALPLPFEEARHAGLDTHGADHLGIAELDQYRAFGMLGVVTGNADLTQLFGGAATGTLHGGLPAGEKFQPTL